MVVYMDDDAAESAKMNCDGLVIDQTSETCVASFIYGLSVLLMFLSLLEVLSSYYEYFVGTTHPSQ